MVRGKFMKFSLNGSLHFKQWLLRRLSKTGPLLYKSLNCIKIFSKNWKLQLPEWCVGEGHGNSSFFCTSISWACSHELRGRPPFISTWNSNLTLKLANSTVFSITIFRGFVDLRQYWHRSSIKFGNNIFYWAGYSTRR